MSDLRRGERAPEDCDECGNWSADLQYDRETGHWVCPKCRMEIAKAKSWELLQDALKRLEAAIEAVPPEVMAERKRQYEDMQKRRLQTEARSAKPQKKRNGRKYNGMANWR
jgi:ribosomal protein L37AE/L43A